MSVPKELVDELKVFLASMRVGARRDKEMASEAEHYWLALVDLDDPMKDGTND